MNLANAKIYGELGDHILSEEAAKLIET